MEGETRNAHLGTEYLAVLETDNSTPYFLNLHNGEVAHTLILGTTGSGKSLLDEKRLEMVARNRNIKAKDGESLSKLLTAFVRKADEGTAGKLIIETVILLSVRSQPDGGKVLRTAAQAYRVDTDAVAVKVKQEFAVNEKARKAAKPELKTSAKANRAA